MRVVFGGETIADSAETLLVWEHDWYPQYYFPRAHVLVERLVPTDRITTHPVLGEARHFTVRVGDQEVPDAAWEYVESPVEAVRGSIRFDWPAMDHWYEEDEEVFVHPRNPYARIDILESSRHVQVELAGVVVADSTRPTLLFETQLPTRYYLPPDDVRLDLLTTSDSSTQCPYKGAASYWSVAIDGVTHHDIVWCYPDPVDEAARIGGLLCFYNERADIIVDGKRQPRPRTQFS